MSEIEKQVDAYASMRPLYESFADRLKALLRDLLDSQAITYQLIESRAKTVESFREKISRAGKNYKDGLTELPDLCGCRIIAYYQDDCKKIAEIIKSNFEIIEEELSHQPESLEADRFGYLSAHYVMRLRSDRLGLDEWKRYAECRVEVQVRTVIQHAWSAVSHALQYKTETAVPSILQRRLYRIAGLFELADEEFAAIRDQKQSLREQASAALASGHTDLPVSLEAIEQYLEQSPIKDRVVSAAIKAGFDYEDEVDNDSIVEIHELLSLNKILSIRVVEESLREIDTSIFERLHKNQSKPSEWTVTFDFLVYILLLSKYHGGVDKEYLVQRGWRDDIAADVVAAIRE